MRFRGQGEARTPASGQPGWRRRFRLTSTRRLVLVAGATVALTSTAAGMTAAAVTAGGAARSAHAAPAVRTGGTGSSGTGGAGATGPAGSRSAHRGDTGAGARSAAAAAHGSAHVSQTRPGQAARPGQAGRLGQAARQRVSHAAARQKTLRTSCRSVAHVGDSTSVDLVSPDYLPDPAQRIGARYAEVGVRHLKIDASGGRSIVEELPGQLNGYKVASAWQSQGFRGCWVFALGTNDAANVAAGSTIGMMARIDQMMAVAHGQPVLWVNTKTLLAAGPYASANERAWDATLLKALAKYPNMRIFNWSAIARPGWFLSDGVHYNSPGCAIRAKAIADALARAFPLHGHSTSRIVR
jgi:hypothetical protein